MARLRKDSQVPLIEVLWILNNTSLGVGIHNSDLGGLDTPRVSARLGIMWLNFSGIAVVTQAL